MGRSYSRKEYLTLVEAIRQRGHIALSTDIICGFCSETEEEYLDTYRLLQEVEYQSAFIFKYSERKNTIAIRKYSDDIPESVKSDRVTRLFDLQRDISRRKNQELIGQTVEVLVEGQSKKSAEQWMGHTESNVTAVWKKTDPSIQPGQMVSLQIYDTSASTLFGSSA